MQGLSIIIPTYNRSQSLSKTVSSLINQKCHIPFEILIIDQNVQNYLLTHLSEEIVTQCKIIHQEKPNVSSARNKGYKNSQYDHLLFIDDDLIAENTFVNDALNRFKKNNFITCLAPLVYTENNKEEDIKNKSQDIKDKQDDVYIISNPISAAFFIKKSTYYKVGGFDPYLFDYCKSTEDNEFFIRLQKHGEKIYYDPSLEILHTEEIEGGCELRKASYIENRLKFIKGWTYRYRIHNGGQLKLKLSDYYHLIRSVILNKRLLRLSIPNHIRLLGFLLSAIKDSKRVLVKNNLKAYYKLGWKTNHLQS